MIATLLNAENPLCAAGYPFQDPDSSSTASAPGIEFTQESLMRAAKEGNCASFRIHLENGVNNYISPLGHELIHILAALGKTEILKILIEHNADVNLPTKLGHTPLMIAVQNGHAEIIKTLVTAPGIDVNQAELHDGLTPLLIAIKSVRRDVNTVTALLAAPGIDVNLPTGCGFTPLMIAVQKKDIEIVTLLLNADGIEVDEHVQRYIIANLVQGASAENLNKSCSNGLTLLLVAEEKGYELLTKALLAL